MKIYHFKGEKKMDAINKKIYNANIQLLDENKKLKKEKKILQKKIINTIEFIKNTKEYYSDGVDKELIDLLKGECFNE